MPLESLQPDARPSVKRVSMEAPEEEKTSEAIQMYEDLKKSDFYDLKYGIWNEYSADSFEQRMLTQLIDLTILVNINNSLAISQLKKLKKINHDSYYWQSKIGYGQDHLITYGQEWAPEQYWGVYILAQIDKEKAEKIWEKLKEKERKGIDMDELLAESQMDPDSAKRKYEKRNQEVKKEDNFWVHENFIYTSEQLKRVIFKAQFNPRKAKELLEKFKDTELFDNKNNLWNLRMNAQTKKLDNDKATEVQLLYILAKRILELKLKTKEGDDIGSMPLQKGYS